MNHPSRRRFFRFLAASPLLARGEARADALNDPQNRARVDTDKPISSPGQALDVFDFEPAMRAAVPPAHFGYMATGVDGEQTLRANRDAFLHYQLRPRRLVDVSQIDTRVNLFGTVYASPIFVCPTGSNKAWHPDGEIAVAKAARKGDHAQILSTVATTSIEDAIAAREGPVWFQLYPTSTWEIAAGLARRAEAAGAPVIAVTLDVLARQNWETLARLRRLDTRDCRACHGSGPLDGYARKPNFDGLDTASIKSFNATGLTWDVVKRLRDTVKTKLVLKGIVTGEDATLALEAGVDGLLVSNHGGRNEDSNRGTIAALPEIAAAVQGKIPVLIDSGFRRGTDIVKALAMGATAVGIGRPYLWGLGAFGQPGVERVLEILRTETRAVMQQIGAPSLDRIVPSMVRRA